MGIKMLVRSSPARDEELCWNWKGERLELDATLRARGRTYNGYPVTRGYFGAFCMDGLAMALWAVYNTSCFDDAVTRCANLLGDADSHASMTASWPVRCMVTILSTRNSSNGSTSGTIMILPFVRCFSSTSAYLLTLRSWPRLDLEHMVSIQLDMMTSVMMRLRRRSMTILVSVPD